MRKIQVLIFIFLIISQVLYSANAPVTMASAVVSGTSSAVVPVTVNNFTFIGSFNLTINYDPAIATATSVVINSTLGGGFDYNNSVPGTITLGWYTYPGITLPDNTTIFSIYFSMISPGSTALTWINNGSSCVYSNGNFVNLNDLPTSSFYINGSLTYALPLTTDFTAGNLNPPRNTTVVFSDLTSGATSWDWSFSPSTVTYVNGTDMHSKNPQVWFTAGGLYTVTLTTHNALYSDSEIKNNFIHAGTPGLWSGYISSDWQNASNWDNLQVPDNSVSITIPSGLSNWPLFNGTLTIGINCAGITIQNNGQFSVTGGMTISAGKSFIFQGNGLLKIGGDWINSGSFIPGTGTVEFFGSSGSSITAGPVINNFYNLTISKTVNPLTVLTTINVNGDLLINP